MTKNPTMPNVSRWSLALTTMTTIVLVGALCADLATTHVPPMASDSKNWFSPTIAELRTAAWQILVTAWNEEPKSLGIPDPMSLIMHIWSLAVDVVTRHQMGQSLLAHTTAIGLPIIGAGVAAVFYLRHALPRRDGYNHVSGPRLQADANADRLAHRALRPARGATGDGIYIAPGARLSREQETTHFVVVGATGSGKTTIQRHLTEQIIQRADRLILTDLKGDVTAGLGQGFLLLAPHDARSAVWAVGRDCLGVQAARELAAKLVREANSKSMWVSGAREILAGAIIALQNRHGMAWSFQELRDLAYAELAVLREQIGEYYPQAMEFLAVDENGIPTKTTTSFLVTLKAGLAPILPALAAAWPNDPKRPRISLRHWLKNESTKDRVVVLQAAPHLPELSQAWMSAMVEMFAGLAIGPTLPDSADRRIWLCLDEFPTLGKLERFEQLLVAGRSKGICTIVGLQDFAQIRALYGNDTLQTWCSTIATKIVCRCRRSPLTSFISKELIGDRIVAWTEKSVSQAPWRVDGSGGGRTVGYSQREKSVSVVQPDFLDHGLGRRDLFMRTEIRALVLGLGSDVYRLSWPVLPKPPVRPATAPAAWLAECSQVDGVGDASAEPDAAKA